MIDIDYLVEVIRVPDDLSEISSNPESELYSTYCIYKKAKDSGLLWHVWLVDEFDQIWIEVNFISPNNVPEFHTLKLDTETYIKHEFETYQALSSSDS